jgi:hypothetical protein
LFRASDLFPDLADADQRACAFLGINRLRQNGSDGAGTRPPLELLLSSRQLVLRFCLKVPGVMALMQLT